MSKDPASVASLGELATLTETPYWYLRSIVERRTDPYMSLQRAKRGGGVRPLGSRAATHACTTLDPAQCVGRTR